MLEIYSSITIRARLGVLLPTSDHKQHYLPRTNTAAMHEFAYAASLKEQPLLREQGRLRVRFTKRLQGSQEILLYCSTNSRRVHFKISIPYEQEGVCWP